MPVATGTRITWTDLPDHVRAAVEDILGGAVASHASQTGGFSPGTADRIVTSDGRRAFVKAVSPAQNPHTPNIHRREAAITAQLPATGHVPRLIGSFDDGEWIALVLEDVDGRHPTTPWEPTELGTVLGALGDLTSAMTPSPVSGIPRAEESLADEFAGWRRIAADSPDDLDPWAAERLDALQAAAHHGLRSMHGDSLVHLDLRADNLLVRDDGSVAFVDWPWACIGAAWLDMALLLTDVNSFGGHDMEALAKEHLHGVDAAAVTGVLAGLAGYYLDMARQPAPPGVPTLRGFQRHQGDTLLSWLERRMSP